MTKRFLISRLSSLGDIVCSLPAAGALKRGIEGAHITWVVDARFAEVVKSCAFVDEVVVWDRRLAGRIGSFDVALDLQGLLKSASVVARAKAGEKVGFHWQREGSALFSRRVIPDSSSVHVVDQYVDVARAVGGVADAAEFGLKPDSAVVDDIRTKLPPQFVVVNPGSARASKRWPAANFAALIDQMPLPSVLIGSPGETSAAEVSALSKTSPTNLSGQTNLPELIALISLAKAHVGGDTGSSHIAAALSAPAIGLYSVTRPERSCPYGQIDRCHFDPDGLDRIRPDEVVRTVKEAIS